MIRAILVDDETLTLQHLNKKLSELGTVEVMNTFSNAKEFLQKMKQLDFQVAFLDIEMPEINGLELAQIIQQWNKNIYIVFVTAHRDYAIQAFELHSIDYLLKPILTYRLEKTIARLQEQILLNQQLPSLKDSTTPAVKIVCFDEFVVYHHDEPVKWKTAKVKELFAFFMTHLHTYVNRDTIIDLLWPEHDYKKAKIQLHTALSHLRKTLESLGYTQVLTFSNQSYILELADFQCDAIHLEQIIDQHPQVTQDNIGTFEEIVRQSSESYLDKNGYEWASVKAQSLLQKRSQLLQKMIDYYHANDELDKKQDYLHHLLQQNPYSEHVLQQLMLHYVKVGNRGDAVKVYHHFSTQLAEDIGIQPNRATQELYETILHGDR